MTQVIVGILVAGPCMIGKVLAPMTVAVASAVRVMGVPGLATAGPAGAKVCLAMLEWELSAV